jgi:hypothetical protein
MAKQYTSLALCVRVLQIFQVPDTGFHDYGFSSFTSIPKANYGKKVKLSLCLIN